jgi:hypothetical protein
VLEKENKMSIGIPFFIISIAGMGFWCLVGYAMGHKEGHREGYTKGRSISRIPELRK